MTDNTEELALEEVDRMFMTAFSGNNKISELRKGASIMHPSKGLHIIHLDDTITDCCCLYGGDPRYVCELYEDSELPRGKLVVVGGKNVTDCSSMFQSLCRYISTIDLRLFNMSNVRDMNAMFSDCTNLETVLFGDYTIDKVTDLNYTFLGCKKLHNIDLSHIHTDNVLGFRQLFRECESLNGLKIGHLKFNVAEDMSGMCSGCSSLTYIDLSSLVLDIDKSDMDDPDFIDDFLGPMLEDIFADCSSLHEVKVNDKIFLRLFREREDIIFGYKKEAYY